ncbi:3-ketoacyl-CoA synthase 5-like [Panicum virgatum]|nr:3-ketoacyl-CoA synthase 5-like [Panicum virgatum]
MILNRYKLRDDIHNVTLSGVGCSAGLISVGLARDLLRVRPAAQHGAHALVVSTETITPNFYKGKNTSMQVTNILFRMGGTAVLLSTSKSMARFRIAHLVRTTTCADDSSYHCIFHEEDVDGTLGMNISRNILATAALKANFTAIGPLVLPHSVQLFYKLFLIMIKYSNGRVKQYHPDFRKAVQHWCIHPGGRPMIDKVQHSLGLSDEQMEPTRMTLHRFGNMSSSTIWYELAYIEAKGRMRKGDRVWMLGISSGFKSNSAVWDCIRPAEVDKAWASCIYRYPVATPTEALNTVS